ncbi:LPD5 domain-containing protein [Vibrio metschnikovii]|uniref:LPD5 domain-containing protein n=1 Tax=Vibrio metschnikovii TaxID=28172 RepID=UPI00164AF60D|nr:LPD5 domain-containing protein [Vibrio metschnikovii]MBC5832232.1 hypothetical protein [Vibrio metschnikovii]
MQDKQMLGQGLLPNTTVNAQVDMSQPTQKPKRFLPENFNPQKYIQKQESENLDVSFMDAVKAVGSGAASMFAGVGELGHQTIGVGAGLRDLSQSVSESLIDSMTPDGQAALNRSLFTENENGRLALGDGASDIDVWAMKIAQGLGSLAGTVLPGGAAGAAARVTLGRAITNNMMKRGLSEVAAKQVADKAVGHIAGAAALGGGFAGSLGGGALDAKAAVLDMDFNWLAENSDTFRDNAHRIMTDPKYADLSPKQRMDLAREETAEHASQSMMANPISIAASAAGALGDKMLFGAITGKLGKSVAGGTIKGAVGEMAAEAMESGGQAYSINTTLNDVAGTDTDPWQGVKSAAAEGGVIGGMVGAPIGAVGGYRGSKQHSPLDQTPPSDNQTTELNSEERVDAPISNQNVSQTAPEQIKARFDDSRSSLVESGVLPEQNDLQETIQLARALDPERAAQIETELKDESISEERANQLEAEYFNLAENARRMDIDPVSAIVEDRLAANKKRSVKSESSQQTEQKIQTELQPETLPAEIADKYGLPRDYEPTRQAQAIREQQGIALRDDLEMRSEPIQAQPVSPSDVNQSAVDIRQLLLESDRQERDKQRLRAKDFEATKNRFQQDRKLSKDDVSIEPQAGKSNFSNRPNSMKLREQGKKPVRDFEGIERKTSAIKKQLTEQLKQESSRSPKANKIEDFGEVLHGAKKHIMGALGGALEKNQSTDDITSQPLSKSWPKPDAKKMIQEGVSPETVAALSIIRSRMAQAKPRNTHKLARWSSAVKSGLDLSRMIANGDIDLSQADLPSTLNDIKSLMKLAKDLTPEQIDKLASYSIRSGSYSLADGKRYNPPKTLFDIVGPPSRKITGKSFESEAEAVAALKELLTSDHDSSTTSKRKANIDVYRRRSPDGQSEYFIGLKAGKNVVTVKDGFDSGNAAREYLQSNREALESKISDIRKKVSQEQRNKSNRDRQGIERRKGDVSPEQFSDAFGFRGVQFGNWVEGARRQTELNDAYDALMDLAELVNIPPKAISLNGKLGLAFGARGSGKAKAHYEPGNVVINLTKTKGAGSLAHEWFHALDNYFGKTAGIRYSEFATDARRPADFRGEIRQEMAEAFSLLRDAIDATGISDRSSKLDAMKSKPYWSTMVEMLARSFESYVIDKNKGKDITNDYLANILSEEQWQSRYGRDPDLDYAYLTKSELNTIKPAFDHFFQTLKHKPDGDGVLLYSHESFLQQAPAKGMTVKGAELAADQWLKNYKGGAGVKIQVVKTQPEAEAIMGASFDGSVVSALYSDARRLVVVVADNIENAKDLRQKLRHEVLVHHGLRAVVGDMEYMKIMERIARGKNSPHLKELWDTVDRNYKGFEPLYQVEEVLAHAAEIERPAIKRWFDNIVEMIAHALRRVGLMSSGDMTKAEMYNIVNTLSDRIKSINQWADKSRPEAKNTETRLSQTLFSQKSRVPEHAEIIKGEPVKGSTMKEKRLYAQQQGFSRAGIYINKDSGLEITVGRTGVKHTTSRKAFDHLLSSMKYIDRIIEDSLYIGSKPEAKGNANVKAHHYFGIKYELEGQVHDVVVDVREMPDGKFYYDHSFEKDVLASGGNDSGSRLLPLEPDNNTSRVAEADEILTTHDSGVNNVSEVHDTGSIKFSKRMDDSTNLDQPFVTNPGAISPRWKELAKLRGWWESASDVLRRNEATKPVAEAIDNFYDLTREHMGTVNTIIDPTFSKYRKLHKADKKAVDKEFEDYMRAKESGNTPDKAKLSNMTRELVETWEQVADVTGRINKEVGVKVYDVVAKEWRDIGFLSKDFWPRKLRPEIQQALADPANHHDTWRAMAQALYDDGRIDSVDYQKASEYIGKEQAKLPKDSHNDYFAGTEQARGVALPAFFYDYTWDAAMQYKDKWAEATARIQSLGQRAVTGQDLIDTTAESITDQNTLKYLRATQDRIYNLVPNDSYIRGAATLNTLATGLQLGNPATALLNLIGGTALNFQAYGPVRATKALIAELKDLSGNIKDARKVGILIDDYLMLQQDATQAGVNESLQKFATNMMKWGGYTPMELFIRTHSHVIAKNMLRESLAAWNQQIDSKKSLKEMAWYQRNGFDVDTLIAENGQGPETNRFYRKVVNTTQGSYRIDQTPIFVDSPIGKFLFKYQKFGTQLSRMFWINHLKPFIDSVTKGGETVKYTKDGKEYSARVKTFMPMVNFFGGAILAGAGLNALRAAIFGYDDPSPNLDEIEKALANDDTAKAVALSASLAWNSMMATGALGFFGNYIQMARDVADRQRVKSPIDPPALAPVKAFAELGLILAEQGTITKKDIDKLADTISIYRTTKRGVLGAADNVGLGFDVARLEGIRRDRNDIRRYIRRYSNDIGLESKRRAPERYGKTEMSPINGALIEAALLGQPERMKAIVRKHLESLKTLSEVQSALTSMRSAIRSAQPIRVSLSPSIRERAEFLKWAEENLTDPDYQKMIEMDRAYVEAATAAGLMTKSRRNELARQERRHRTLTREFDSDRARENFLRRLGV